MTRRLHSCVWFDTPFAWLLLENFTSEIKRLVQKAIWAANWNFTSTWADFSQLKTQPVTAWFSVRVGRKIRVLNYGVWWLTVPILGEPRFWSTPSRGILHALARARHNFPAPVGKMAKRRRRRYRVAGKCRSGINHTLCAPQVRFMSSAWQIPVRCLSSAEFNCLLWLFYDDRYTAARDECSLFTSHFFELVKIVARADDISLKPKTTHMTSFSYVYIYVNARINNFANGNHLRERLWLAFSWKMLF